MAIGTGENDLGPGPWPAAEVAQQVMDRLGIRPRVLRPLQWKANQGTPLYYVETEDGRFVLKLPTPRPSSRSQPLRAYLTRQEISHQARVIEQLGNPGFRHLRVPRMVASDRRSFVLLQYVETKTHGEFDLPQDEVLQALLEFQTANIELPRLSLVDLGRDPGLLTMRKLWGRLRPHMGWRLAARATRVIIECYRSQPRLDRPVLRHNDFHYNNLLLDHSGRLYFSDFEYVAYDDRWALGDIIYFATGTNRFGVDLNLIYEYYRMLTGALGFDFDLEAQLRFNLIWRVGKLMVSRTAPPEVANAYGEFMREVLLDDRRFAEWFAAGRTYSLATEASGSTA